MSVIFANCSKRDIHKIFFLNGLSVNAWCQLKEGHEIIDSQNLHTHIIIQSIFAPFSNETCNGEACKSYYIDRIEDFTIQLTQSNHFISLNVIMIFCGSCNLYL